ncbi:hypothetical protein BD770DRAFT_380851 [Pilaira anomala]|nr:hypothetical protein BD770DRAFT_380851 [Pilaira anomala]
MACAVHMYLSDATRRTHNIPDGILKGKVAHWKNMEKLVRDYFENVQVPTRKWQNLYYSVKRSLPKLKESSSNRKFDVILSRYASKSESYIAGQDVIYNFQDAFRSSLLAHDLKTSRDRALSQGRITGNVLSELGAQELANEVNNMMGTQDANIDVLEADQNDDLLEADQNDDVLKGDDPFAPIYQSPMESHITIVKGNSIYQLQTPSKNVASPNKPALQREDTEQLTSIADICINSSTRENCSKDLLQLSSSIITKRKEYSPLHSLEVFDLAIQCTSFQDKEIIDDSLANVHPGTNADPVLSKFIKKTVSEFALSSQRAASYTSDDERTIYIEMFVPDIYQIYIFIIDYYLEVSPPSI